MSLTTLAAATVTATLVGAVPATSAPTITGEYPLSDKPVRLATGPDGNVWATIGGVNDVARVRPDGTVTEFDLPGVAGPTGVTTGPDGNLWLTVAGAVARVPPLDPGATTTFAIPGLVPREIVTGPDGNLWTTNGDRVLRIPPGNPAAATSFVVPDLDPRGIAASADGQLWIADFGGTTNGRVIRMAPDGTYTAIPTGGGVMDVATLPGGAVGFTNPLADPQFVGRLAPDGELRTQPTPGADPFGIAGAIDGAFWTANFAEHTLGRIGPDGSYTTLGGLSAGSGPRYLTAGPDGTTLWVGLENAERIARVSGIEPPPSGGGGGDGPSPTPPADRRAPADRTAPRILRLSAFPTRFRAGPRLRAQRAGRTGVATRVTVAVDERSTVRMQLLRVRDGYRSGGRCRVGRAPSATATRCVREQSVQVRTFRVSGTRRIIVTGRVGKRSLSPGRYRLRVVATDAAGNRSTARTISLRIVR